MTRKFLKTTAIVVIALAPVVAAGTAEAHGGGFGGGGFHAEGFHGSGLGRGVFATAALVATGFGLLGFLEGFTPATMEAITPATTDTALAI
jgi:hypothetical protein